MLHQTCPCCGKSDIEGFFKIKNAPIFSLVTVKSKEEALRVPRKDLELGFCHSCGFIFNRLFDTSIDYFTLGYEDQQGFSATFMSYLKRISEDLIDRYHLKGKTLLEIGCGKGDFINLLQELNQGKGVGIDPAYQDGRQTNPNLTFYKEFYKPEHGKIPADFICCRHTLEHIHNTRGFLQLIRESLGTNTEKIIFFEIPQITRILEVQAFWDIYYEHCSYFSAGSLARLFRDTGFEILNLHLDYNDQYLLIEAKPVNTISHKAFPIEESIEDQKKKVENFKIKISEQLNDWSEKLHDFKKLGKRTVVWGGGSKSVGFLTNFAEIGVIEYVVDINPHMKGNYIPGIGIQYVSPDQLKEIKPEVVIIMNSVYMGEIKKTLNDMDLFPELIGL